MRARAQTLKPGAAGPGLLPKTETGSPLRTTAAVAVGPSSSGCSAVGMSGCSFATRTVRHKTQECVKYVTSLYVSRTAQ